MKVYGTPICIDCRNYRALQQSRGFAAEYIDITASTTTCGNFWLCGTMTPCWPRYGSAAASASPFLCGRTVPKRWTWTKRWAGWASRRCAPRKLWSTAAAA